MIKSPESLYEGEWILNKQDSTAPPHFGVCFSGGGNRSAAFAIGVLRALHEQELLAKVDVMSAVSGGSYALSWFLLQSIYHRASQENPKAMLGQIHDQMFDLDGPFQRYLAENDKPLGAPNKIHLFLQVLLSLPIDLVTFNVLRIFSLPLSLGSKGTKFANISNAQSMFRTCYRDGIQRTYQVFPDIQKKIPSDKLGFFENAFIASVQMNVTRHGVVPVPFPAMAKFAQRAGLPSFVFNTTVCPPRPNAEIPLSQRIFELGSMGLGSDSCGYLGWADTEGLGWEPGAQVDNGWMFRGLDGDPQNQLSPYAIVRNFNVAPAISGAALSGTNIEQLKTRWLLQFLNMGLEYVVPSPMDRSQAVRLSDGGHSENLGAYALLRRRCRTILVVDAEYDPTYGFGAYRNLKKAARDELGITINIPGLEKILNGTAKFEARVPILEGTTRFDEQHQGKIYYMKLSMHTDLLGDRVEIIESYWKKHHEFPQEPTSDQYFQPSQFKAYRALGYTIARTLPSYIVA